MDSRSRLDEYPASISNGVGTDREERLLRFVDILRTEQVRATIVPNDEASGTGFHRWRALGLLLGIAVIVMGTAAAFLQISGPSHVHPSFLPKPPVEVVQVQPASKPARSGQQVLPPNIWQPQPHEDAAGSDLPANGQVAPAGPDRSVPGALSLSNHPLEAPLAGQNAADPPKLAEATTAPAAVTAPPNPVEPSGPEHNPNVVASPQPTRAAQEISASETAKPVLWVYFPKGSLRSEVNAWSLSVRTGSNFANSDFKAQTNLPSDAVVKFSDERDHALARLIGKYLGDAGYKWKIENAAGSVDSRRNLIEVWLPMK
jgi:hypothetical protein